MYQGDWLDKPAYLYLQLSHLQTYLSISFELGCHPLRIVAGRWQGSPRLQRICDRCTTGALDDECHLVFECPAFEQLRADSRHLLGPQVAFDMRRIFAHDSG